jgi:endonuclease YncB( thermonuclease family)
MPIKHIFLSFFISIFIFISPAHSDLLQGKVVRIIDGDTVVILDQNNEQHKIRLQGIDAPERKQAFGKKSTIFLADSIAGKNVSIEFRKKDRYDRIIGKFFFNNIDVNLEQVRAGFAWHYKKYQREQNEEDRASYAYAENEARENLLGLWVDPHAIPPWDWRRRKR